MTTWTIYGEGGYCADCTPEHDHPLHNIISETVTDEPEQ